VEVDVEVPKLVVTWEAAVVDPLVIETDVVALIPLVSGEVVACTWEVVAWTPLVSGDEVACPLVICTVVACPLVT
jgi:hypothetical protein